MANNWTYEIIEVIEKQNPEYVDYTFKLLYAEQYIMTRRMYGVKVSEKDKIFEGMTRNLPELEKEED